MGPAHPPPPPGACTVPKAACCVAPECLATLRDCVLGSTEQVQGEVKLLGDNLKVQAEVTAAAAAAAAAPCRRGGVRERSALPLPPHPPWVNKGNLQFARNWAPPEREPGRSLAGLPLPCSRLHRSRHHQSRGATAAFWEESSRLARHPCCRFTLGHATSWQTLSHAMRGAKGWRGEGAKGKS